MAKLPDAFDRVIAGNKSYSKRLTSFNPELLTTLSAGQSPEVLWIGCADSRVPETTICDCQPGDIFVHRNIANVLHPSDVSSQSVIEYAVGNLKVKRIIVCGHTKCGGATAALSDADLGETLNTWLSPVREIRKRHEKELGRLQSTDEKANYLAELNVQNSLETLKRNKTVLAAIRDRGLQIYGLIYDIPAAELRVIGQVKMPVANFEEHRFGHH
ncbi:carbonic anhydrase [Rhizodiscina lignyota]|uniref:Carbonic anhydrase n=1 Tax=Rhizodiscina lignyota TaxID=1504668 RepID=A0A9P4IR74_9PEZI|nr:carbonic anhydrase [Rhizodiscina lignyota]